MKIAIVIPVYGSADILEEGHAFISKILKEITLGYEILYRNDCSPDNSQIILDKLVAKDKKVRTFTNTKNMGLGYTLRKLFNDAQGEYVIYLDADAYQCFDLTLIKKFIDDMKDRDVTIASRYEIATRQIPWYREYPSTIYYLINKILFGMSIRDVGSGFVIFKKKALNKINLTSKGFDIHVEIFAKLVKTDASIREIPITYKHWYGGSFDVFKHGPKTVLNTIKWFFLIRIFNKR